MEEDVWVGRIPVASQWSILDQLNTNSIKYLISMKKKSSHTALVPSIILEIGF